MPKLKVDIDWIWSELHAAYFDEAKFVTIRAGRRSFKTAGAVRWLIENLIDNAGESGLWVDTRQNNLDKYVDRYFRPVLGELWEYCKYNNQKKILTLPNESYIDFGSAERPENLEGFEYDFVLLNEAGIILKKDSLWDNTIMPMTKKPTCKVRIVGTSKGKNKFHKLCHLSDEDWSHYHFTIHDVPSILYSKDQIAKIKATVPDAAWRQEYMAEFLEGSGSVFRNIGGCFGDKRIDEPEQGANYVLSVDVAKHQDYTVVYVADTGSSEIVYQDRFNQIDWGMQKRRIIEIYNRFGCMGGIMDSTGVGDGIYDDLTNAGLALDSFKYTQATKSMIIQNLSVAIDNKAISFYPFEDLVSELEVFEYSMTKMGNVSYNAPDGHHDDCVNSLAMMNHKLNTNINIDYGSFTF